MMMGYMSLKRLLQCFQEPIEHRELMTLLEPINALQNEVMKKSLLMLQNEGLENSDTITDPNSFYYNNPEQYAMDRYSFYQCNVCKKVSTS